MEPFSHEHTANEDEKTQGQHLDGGMAIHEVADLVDEQKHDDHGDDVGGDHHTDLLDHTAGGDDRVERKDDVEQHDLHDDAIEARGHLLGFLAVHAFEFFVNLVSALGQ